MNIIERRRSFSEFTKELLIQNKKGLRPLLAATPFLLALYYKFSDIKDTINTIFSFIHLDIIPAFLNSHEAYILMVAIFIPIVMAIKVPALTVAYEVETYHALLSAIEDIVIHKAENIGSLLRETFKKKNPIFCDQILKRSNPEEQLKEIILSLQKFLSNHANNQDIIKSSKVQNTKFKIVLYQFKSGEILDETIHIAGSHPTIDRQKLMNHDTAIKRAFEKRKSVCIQDTSDSKPDSSGGLFIEPGPEEENSSLFCIPIYEEHLHQVLMVLSILCVNRPNYFLRTQLKKWTNLITPFLLRIKLETCNQECTKHILKFRSCSEQKCCSKEEAE